MQLDVILGTTPVGHLRLTSEGRGIDQLEFEFLDSYWSSPVRPVLGQKFEDDHRPLSSRMRAPPWFSNLLPEGPLRELVAARLAVSGEREFFLLAALGADLPGAVRVLESPSFQWPAPEDAAPPHSPAGTELRFSLAGVQLKFSMLRVGKGLTIPARGVDGDWIVKIPGTGYEAVSENEFSMMSWARAAGMTVADHALVPFAELSNLPSEVARLTGNVFATKRFDRTPEGRVHQEDFAQVLGVYPTEKYRYANYETIANLYLRVAGLPALHEFVRRLVFVIASGNEDAHLKNWSFVYPAAQRGVAAAISPAYDFLSTIQYDGLQRGLGLKLGGTREFSAMSLLHFEKLGQRLKVDLAPIAREAAAQTRAAWAQVRGGLPLPDHFKIRLDAHLASIPLFGSG